MSATVRPTVLLAAAVLLGIGCGSGSADLSVSGDSPADRETAAEIAKEIEESFSGSIDLTAVPPDQAAELEAFVDNLQEAPGSVVSIDVSEGVATVETDLDSGPEGAVTATLICGAIVRAAGQVQQRTHTVLAADQAPIRTCKPSDRNYP